MKLKYFALFFVSLLVISLILTRIFLNEKPPENENLDFFVGIDVAYDDLVEIKKLIDEINSYTNVFVIGCTGITHNDTKLDDICQYLYDNDLSFIVYTERFLRAQWIENARIKWGTRFLGFYLWDENGGRQLDLHRHRAVMEADNYTDARNKFVDRTNRALNYMTREYANSTIYPLFTSDYALYWYVYKAGYDVIFAQFGWNYSRQLNVALCRGAATVQNKEWGVMITWTYNSPPHIESGELLYDDLVLAYENGAKYILIFDSDMNYTQGILQDEHLNALKQFWQYTQNNPRTDNPNNDRVAYVLPKDYAYGFRGPEDKIWGLWEADSPSFEISENLGDLLKQYDSNLDVIHDDGLDLNDTYNKYFFCNGTIYIP